MTLLGNLLVVKELVDVETMGRKALLEDLRVIRYADADHALHRADSVDVSIC